MSDSIHNSAILSKFTEIIPKKVRIVSITITFDTTNVNQLLDVPESVVCSQCVLCTFATTKFIFI